jgi:hypothetical protein
MAILTRDDFIASQKQRLPWTKTTARTTVAGRWYSMFELAGNPGAGVLAGGETTPPANTIGRFVTDAIPGYPSIVAFAGGATGYVGRIWGMNTVQAMIRYFDRLFVAGPYTFNANVALPTPPSYSARLPLKQDATPNYAGLELWVEQVTASTGNLAVNVTYADELGNTGNTTGAVGIGAAPTVGTCWQLPLAAGDSGVQAVRNVQGTVATAGTFNVMVLRPLGEIFVPVANNDVTRDFITTNLPVVFADSAIYPLIMAPAGTTSGLPITNLDVNSK